MEGAKVSLLAGFRAAVPGGVWHWDRIRQPGWKRGGPGASGGAPVRGPQGPYLRGFWPQRGAWTLSSGVHCPGVLPAARCLWSSGRQCTGQGASGREVPGPTAGGLEGDPRDSAGARGEGLAKVATGWSCELAPAYVGSMLAALGMALPLLRTGTVELGWKRVGWLAPAGHRSVCADLSQPDDQQSRDGTGTVTLCPDP